MDIDGDFRSELVGKEGQNARFVESLLCTPKIVEPTDYTILSLLYQKYNDPIPGNPLPFKTGHFEKFSWSSILLIAFSSTKTFQSGETILEVCFQLNVIPYIVSIHLFDFGIRLFCALKEDKGNTMLTCITFWRVFCISLSF